MKVHERAVRAVAHTLEKAVVNDNQNNVIVDYVEPTPKTPEPTPPGWQ
jgi:hypothetical protein